MTEAQIARATKAEAATIRLWLQRLKAHARLEAQRLTELVAFVEEMARNIRGDASPSGSTPTSTFSTVETRSTSSPPEATSG